MAVINSRMVASAHNIDDLHPNNVDQQQHQQPQQHLKNSLSAQDKRSRLSNVINNLHKKVPEPESRPEVDTRNSVERNLETLEKYVMTVLNGVIKEEEEKREPENKSEEEKAPEANFEPSQPNDVGMVEAAVPERPEVEEVKLEEVEDDQERTLGTIIMDRLNEHESKVICRDVLDNAIQEVAKPSLQCSLPLERVASVLPEVKMAKSAKASSVRHLCLFCDRKFMSTSLRQRHTERVHHQSGGRRSERNLRKSFQNCQYCSEKCSESLDGLFQHLVGSHGDKYHGCLLCRERYVNKDTLAGHNADVHGGVVVEKSQVRLGLVGG